MRSLISMFRLRERQGAGVRPWRRMISPMAAGLGGVPGGGGLEDGGDLAEEVGAEETGGDDSERFGRGGVEVCRSGG